MLTLWVLGAPGYHKCSALVNLYSKKKICHEKLVFLPMTDDPLFAFFRQNPVTDAALCTRVYHHKPSFVSNANVCIITSASCIVHVGTYLAGFMLSEILANFFFKNFGQFFTKMSNFQGFCGSTRDALHMLCKISLSRIRYTDRWTVNLRKRRWLIKGP